MGMTYDYEDKYNYEEVQHQKTTDRVESAKDIPVSLVMWWKRLTIVIAVAITIAITIVVAITNASIW